MVDERRRAKPRRIGGIQIDQRVLLANRIARPDRDELARPAVESTVFAGDIPVVGRFDKIHLHGRAFDHLPEGDLFCVVLTQIHVILELDDEVSHLGGVVGGGTALPVGELFFGAFPNEPEDLPEFFSGGFPVVGDKGKPLTARDVVDEVTGGFFFEADGVSFVVEGVQENFGRGELPAGHGLSLPGRDEHRVEEPKKERFFGSFGFVVDDVFFDGPTKIDVHITGGEDVDKLTVFVEVEPVGLDVETDFSFFRRKRFCDRFFEFGGVARRKRRVWLV